MWLTLVFIITFVAVIAIFLFAFLGLRALKKGIAYNDEILKAMYSALVERGKDGAFIKVIKRNGDGLFTIFKKNGSIYILKEGELNNTEFWENLDTLNHNIDEYAGTSLCAPETLEKAISELSRFDSRSLRLLVPAA